MGKKPKVQGIVLAGVHSWGESALERICPRPLLPIAGRPLVWYSLDWLLHGGVDHVTLCANSDTCALQSCLGDGSRFGMCIDFYEDVMPRGPAGCTRDAAHRSDADLYVVIEGTLLPRVDLREVLGVHRRSGPALTIVANEQSDSAGNAGGLEPAGIYVVTRTALDLVPVKGYQDIKEMWIPRLYQHGYGAVAHAVRTAALRVMGVQDYRSAILEVLTDIERTEAWKGSYRREGGVLIHETARVATSVVMAGQVLIGPHTTIEEQTAILGPTVIGQRAWVGPGSVLSDVIVWSGCRVGAGAVLNRSLLLTDSEVGAGLVVRDSVWGADSSRGFGANQMDNYWAMEGDRVRSYAADRMSWRCEEPVLAIQE